MRCESVSEQLSAHFDGELSQTLSHEIELHVGQCRTCREELDSYARISRLVGQDWNGSQPPPWAAFAAKLQTEHAMTENVSGNSPAARKRQSMVKDILIIAASLAASIAIITWSWRASPAPEQVADAGHRHLAERPLHATSISFQDTVSLQQEDTELAMRALAKKYAGREASADEVVKQVGFRTLVQSPLPSGAKLISTQLLTLPQCACVAGECMCGPGDCNCVACVCERPDGSTFLVIEQCSGQSVDFGELPVRLVQHGDHELHVTGNEQGLAVAWTANQTRKIAIGLRDLNEMDRLLAAN
tara:strand:- start:1683 stop:2588 length:906 start_codon:yes stop_codon:yes gene_type:complete